MDKQNYIVSKKLSKLDLNKHTDEVDLYTYWCRVVYADYEHWNPKEHAHSFWELHLCLSGKCRILVEGTEYVLSENTYLFLIPRSMHTILFESNDYSEFVWGFSIENNKGTNDMLCDKYKNTGIMSADNQMLSSVSLILDNVRNAEYGSYNIIKNELHHIFVIMARKVGFQKDGMHRKIMNKELELIRKYICENMFLDVGIDDVAADFYISKSSLERMCKKEYSMTFSQMKRELKLKAIRRLLRETDCSMEEIAVSTGFSDRYSMGKFFKKLEGSTPGEYRRGTKK